jgi:hypothetical protein
MWTASPVTQSKVPFRASSYPDMGAIGQTTSKATVIKVRMENNLNCLSNLTQIITTALWRSRLEVGR